MALFNKIMSIILPPRCALTGDIVDAPGMISSKAWASLRFVAAPCCVSCGVPFDIDSEAPEGVSDELSYQKCAVCIATPPLYTEARAAVVYDEQSRNLILAFKHADQTHLTVTFTPWLETLLIQNQWMIDYIIPVPLHWTRLFKRRYNQSALLAHSLSQSTKIPALVNCLKRMRATDTQAHLKVKDRHENVKNAFDISLPKGVTLSSKSILLIDDVYTTGATIHECTKTLFNAGVKAVYVVTLARAVRDDVSA